MKLIWSSFSESQLDEIFEYYSNKANINVAKKLINEIIEAPSKLLDTPLIGQKEELLQHRQIQYRYLIHKNYKLIYSVDEVNQLIKIADIFDTRQNPIKITRTP